MSEFPIGVAGGAAGSTSGNPVAPGAGSSVWVAEYRIWVQRHFTLRVRGTALGLARGGDREEEELEIRAA